MANVLPVPMKFSVFAAPTTVPADWIPIAAPVTVAPVIVPVTVKSP